jgi:hypothetical protein
MLGPPFSSASQSCKNQDFKSIVNLLTSKLVSYLKLVNPKLLGYQQNFKTANIKFNYKKHKRPIGYSASKFLKKSFSKVLKLLIYKNRPDKNTIKIPRNTITENQNQSFLTENRDYTSDKEKNKNKNKNKTKTKTKTNKKRSLNRKKESSSSDSKSSSRNVKTFSSRYDEPSSSRRLKKSSSRRERRRKSVSSSDSNKKKSFQKSSEEESYSRNSNTHSEYDKYEDSSVRNSSRTKNSGSIDQEESASSSGLIKTFSSMNSRTTYSQNQFTSESHNEQPSSIIEESSQVSQSSSAGGDKSQTISKIDLGNKSNDVSKSIDKSKSTISRINSVSQLKSELTEESKIQEKSTLKEKSKTENKSSKYRF